MTQQSAMRSLGDIVRFNASVHPERTAIAFEGHTTSYRELDERASQVAQALIAAGLRPGDRIAYLAKNSDRYFELLFGAAKAGVVLTPVNWRLSTQEVRYILDDSDARLLFIGPEFMATLDDVTARTQVQRALALEASQGSDTYIGWRDAHAPRDSSLALPPDAAVLQLYTSGTTGQPKGVVLTHGNFIALQLAQAGYEWNRWTETDASIIAIPLFHVAGASWAIAGLYHGGLNVVLREFDAAIVLELMQTWRISKLLMVPAALQIVIRQPGARQVDYSRLKHVLYGASPMPLELLRECMDVFGCEFVQLYGMTETAGGIVALGPEDHGLHGNRRIAAAGKPLPGVDVVILNERGERLPADTVGEIAIRSPTTMQGYWKLPEATARTIGTDGWLRTGDAGYLDEDGYLYIHDRVKDMIISGGENIYPAEVENAIFGHPDVADVAVIGVPSERWGEEVKAMVVAKPGATRDELSIIRWARERIAGYKIPKSVDFIDALPRNASGKILRRELRAPYWEGRARQI